MKATPSRTPIEAGRAARALDTELRDKFSHFLDCCRRLIEREEAKAATDEDLKIVAAHLARREPATDGEA